MTEEQLRARLRLEVEQESQNAVAKRLGVAQASVGRVVHGGPIPESIAQAMGFRRVIRFERVDNGGRR